MQGSQVVQVASGGGKQITRTPLHHPLAPQSSQQKAADTAKSLPSSLLQGRLVELASFNQPHSPLCTKAIDQVPRAAIVPMAGAASAPPRSGQEKTPPPKPGHHGESGGSPAPPHTLSRRGPGHRLAGGRCGPCSCQLGRRRGSMRISGSKMRRQREVEREQDREEEE